MMFLSQRVITARDNRLALYPTILYGVFYVLNNVINGIGTWLLGRLIRLVNSKRMKRNIEEEYK